MKLAIINGYFIDPANNISGNNNIFVQDSVITYVGLDNPDESYQIIDAKGKIVCPGFIDLHVHLREPGFEYKEDITSGSRAAVAGGYTSIFCMPNTKPVNDCVKIVQYIKKRAKEVELLNIYPVPALSVELKGKYVSDIPALAKEGIQAISDDGLSTKNDAVMVKAMEMAAKYDLVVTTHPEDFSITGKGRVNTNIAHDLNLPSISPEAEESIIERDIKIAIQTGARLHVGHVSTAKGIDLIRKGKSISSNITCEVTPHHLLLNETAVKKYGANAMMKPPLRTENDRLALINGLRDGIVDAIATDHAPHSVEEKIDIQTTAFGVIGMETAFPVCYKLVEDGYISLNHLIELFTIKPAKIMKIRGGTLSIGEIADIAILKKNPYRIDSSLFSSKSRNTPFNNWNVQIKISSTIVNGTIVFHNPE